MAENSSNQDPRFPDGAWVGFYIQKPLPGRQWMELWLTFRDSAIRGEGRDRVGKFLITGRFSSEEGKCQWQKKYIGKHDVFYVGYNEGKGIWGKWELWGYHGGFHIWPEGMPNPHEPSLDESVEEPVANIPELVESEARTCGE